MENTFLITKCMLRPNEGSSLKEDEILKVKGLDAILIGPYDLSASLGITGKFESKKFKKKSYVVAVSGGPDSLALTALTSFYNFENDINANFYRFHPSILGYDYGEYYDEYYWGDYGD